MNFTHIRRTLLKVFLGFLSLTALLAIVSVLSSEFGKTQWKIMATTVSISAGSICAMSCAALLERKRAKWAGFTGSLAASAAIVMVIIGAWGEVDASNYWKSTATAGVVAVAFAHGCLLCLPKLSGGLRWTLIVSTILDGLLAGQIIVAAWWEIDDGNYYRAMAATSVLVVLMTLVIPICGRLGAKASEQPGEPDAVAVQPGVVPDLLTLRKVAGDVFVDPSGHRFQVTEIKTET